MSLADLTAARWAGLDDHQALAHAERLAEQFSADLLCLEDADYAGRRLRRALFHRDGITYALVPGGEVRIGFDPACFTPSPQQGLDIADRLRQR
ncbi:hypothetical protein [Planomonospora venezuelensis]|uniref:Uncharacterized protein n=1 Tax=Planomonospora venezuelensis TaxID=1999 RepID=A0A841DAC4_PLAVE|nr:hypothetical protein [Planomonospora venezuelensis]MBB5966429.1 hypothetical protein [Planomonospora venezuelensis]